MQVSLPPASLSGGFPRCSRPRLTFDDLVTHRKHKKANCNSCFTFKCVATLQFLAALPVQRLTGQTG